MGTSTYPKQAPRLSAHTSTCLAAEPRAALVPTADALREPATAANKHPATGKDAAVAINMHSIRPTVLNTLSFLHNHLIPCEIDKPENGLLMIPFIDTLWPQ